METERWGEKEEKEGERKMDRYKWKAKDEVTKIERGR